MGGLVVRPYYTHSVITTSAKFFRTWKRNFRIASNTKTVIAELTTPFYFLMAYFELVKYNGVSLREGENVMSNVKCPDETMNERYTEC